MAYEFPRSGKTPGTFLWDRVIAGPVRSRRLGISLGLNIIPAHSKLCTFNCPYCECGFNTAKAEGEKWPSPDVVADVLSKTLTLGGGMRPDWVTFAGNGEPTMHPRFAVVVDRVLEVRDALAPQVQVGILSNGLSAGKPGIRDALNRLDARMMKLDPGPVELVNAVAYDRELLVSNYRALNDVIIQAMIVDGPAFSGSSDAAITAWLPFLGRIHPKAVHLYSLDRAPADGSLKRVARKRLMEIAVRARRVVQGPVEVF